MIAVNLWLLMLVSLSSIRVFVLESSPPEDFSHWNDLGWQMGAGVCVVRPSQVLLRRQINK